ncbi:MAG: 3'-5' exonuclease, partial [Pseudomonadota bacterium]
EEVIDEILEFMGDSILVAHNTSFDVPFFNSVLTRLGRPTMENKNLCTNLMTKYMIPNLLNSNLNYMSKIFRIQHHHAHRALDDALATANLLLKFLHIFIEKGINKVNHLYYPQNRYELDQGHLRRQDSDADKDRLMNFLKKPKAPYLVTSKGPNGIIIFSLPCIGGPVERSFIKDHLEHLDWEITTVKLYGSFLDALISFNHYFPKIHPDSRDKILQFLWDQHAKDNDIVLKTPNEKMEISVVSYLEDDFGDFVIANHLIPEQYIIYPLRSMHSKSALIFRYPGHRKKLIQYIVSKSARLMADKIKKFHFAPGLKKFIAYHLMQGHKKRDLFIFKKSLPAKREKQFLEMLENFQNERPAASKYPVDFI